MQHYSTSGGLDSDNVRRKAYELWVNGGRRAGVAEQNWLEAERILSSKSQTISTAPALANAPPVAAQGATPVHAPERPNSRTTAKPNGQVKRTRQ